MEAGWWDKPIWQGLSSRQLLENLQRDLRLSRGDIIGVLTYASAVRDNVTFGRKPVRDIVLACAYLVGRSKKWAKPIITPNEFKIACSSLQITRRDSSRVLRLARDLKNEMGLMNESVGPEDVVEGRWTRLATLASEAPSLKAITIELCKAARNGIPSASNHGIAAAATSITLSSGGLSFSRDRLAMLFGISLPTLSRYERLLKDSVRSPSG